MIADLQISPAVVNIPDGTLVHMLGNPDGPENERLKTGICPLTADGGSTLSPMTRAAIYARYGTIQRKRKTRSKTKTQVIATTA